MPYRYEPCTTSETYHIFNRSVANQAIFTNNHDHQRFIDLLQYYRFEKPPTRFSEYRRLSITAQNEIESRLKTKHEKLISILAFCCMPNHFHLLLQQLKDNGIALFLSQLQNGYAKYFNVKSKRFGAVFQSMFKAVRIETDDQLIHVARYIHLNPLSANIVTTIKDLFQYRWSSLQQYVEQRNNDLVDTTFLLSNFHSTKNFRQNLIDQADYQRYLFVESHLYHDYPHPGGVGSL